MINIMKAELLVKKVLQWGGGKAELLVKKGIIVGEL